MSELHSLLLSHGAEFEPGRDWISVLNKQQMSLNNSYVYNNYVRVLKNCSGDHRRRVYLARAKGQRSKNRGRW